MNPIQYFERVLKDQELCIQTARAISIATIGLQDKLAMQQLVRVLETAHRDWRLQYLEYRDAADCRKIPS